MENGYHDNPTLEVMETPSEMQEKKVVNLNGELGDSWIVPLDNLTKDDLDEEEDTPEKTLKFVTYCLQQHHFRYT